jgi:eukaryotic-like serine/threonine-protein kinase
VQTPERWKRVKELFVAALEFEGEQRRAYLERECDGNDSVCAEVQSLLRAHMEAGGLSEYPSLGPLLEANDPMKIIGPYELVRKLGEGGMGQVWLAQQTFPVRRLVALKLIRGGMFDHCTLRRFQSERQSLAMMDHPAIAKVFDAGETSEGQPYLVMEYVPGVSIVRFCDEKRLNIRERLELFVRVCEAMQHAHQKTIIHRDLKPANILVLEVDGKPRPRLIDFGLAKAAVLERSGESLLTKAGLFLGTPGYMSPEQADPNVQDIDTRTDVYSLGVVLYELLTGQLPFDTTCWKKQRLEETLRELRETNPQPPSTRVSVNHEASKAVAEARNTDSKQLVALLRGDLDCITMMALEKERERMFPTPIDLAADIARHLENRPVVARPASAAYHVRKYVRRNRIGVAVVTGAMALLIAFALIQAIQLRHITRERDRADRITEFMSNMFKVSDPSEARGNSITAREILDESASKIDTELTQDPELQAQMLHVMGTVYDGLGLYGQAETLLARAVEIRSRILGAEHPRTLDSKNRLSVVLNSQGRYAEAEKTSREVVEVDRRVLGPDSRATLIAASNLAWVMESEGRVSEAGRLCQQTLQRQQKLFGRDDTDTLRSLSRCAFNLNSAGRYKEAEEMDRQLLATESRMMGPENALTLVTMTDLATNLVSEGRVVEGEQLLRRTLELQRKVFGTEHQDTLATLDGLGNALQHEGRYAEAEKIYREALEAAQRTLGKEHRNALISMGNLADVIQSQGRYKEAERMKREVYEKRRRALGSEDPDTLLAIGEIGAVLDREHRYEEAVPLLQKAVEDDRRILGDDNPQTVEAEFQLAHVLAVTQKPGEAIELLHEAMHHGLDPEALEDLKNGSDWKSLRGDPRIGALIQTERRAATESHESN